MTKSKQDLKSLSGIFSRDNVRFYVPDYQRGYSWEMEPQLNDLWEDLENMTDERDHYTGMFTFCKDEDDENVYYIVDGQQRMTTLIILINELLNRISGPIDDYTLKDECVRKYLYVKPVGGVSSNIRFRFQYSDDDPSDAYFKTRILGQGVVVEDPQKNTLYTQNLQNAKKFFEEKIEALSEEALVALFKKVTERLKFNEYLIDDVEEVYVTFETMNNRGKSLSTLELLKNRLIYLTTIFQSLRPTDSLQKENAKSLRESINKTWKTVYSFLGKSCSKNLNDDAFLRDHWIMYFRYDRKMSMVFKDDLLSKTFTAKRVLNNELTMNDIDDYVKSLFNSVIYWFNINCPKESSLTENEKIWLTRLDRVGMGSFRPLLMAVYVKGNTKIIQLLEACERFRFLVSSVTDRRSNTADYHFYGLAHDFFVQTKTLTLNDLINDVKSQTDEWFNIQNFINASVDRYKKREGFYSWSGLRYFLYEYERHLQPAGEDDKVIWETFENNQQKKVSIEHIYPQTPTDNYWISRFKAKEDQALTHSLGNLLLLSVAKNSIEQNLSFDIKKTTRRNDEGKIEHLGYDEGSYSEIEVSKESQWTAQEIVKRGKTLLRFLIDHWSIDSDLTNDDINKLLNISTNTYTAEKALTTQEEPDWDISQDETV